MIAASCVAAGIVEHVSKKVTDLHTSRVRSPMRNGVLYWVTIRASVRTSGLFL
jgi:hypothetical protein